MRGDFTCIAFLLPYLSCHSFFFRLLVFLLGLTGPGVLVLFLLAMIGGFGMFCFSGGGGLVVGFENRM